MKKRRPSPLLRGGLMMLSIGAVTLLWPRLEPAAVALLQKAALFTTVLDMPAGALETLRERYAAELEPAPLPEEPPEPAAGGAGGIPRYGDRADHDRGGQPGLCAVG